MCTPRQWRFLARFSCLATIVAITPAHAGAQAAASSSAREPHGVTSTQTENAIAVATSGVWNIDGEYRGQGGVYYKLTGYFAYVGSTSQSKDKGDRAVVAFYLEPMAGGASRWIGAHLACKTQVKPQFATQCVALDGASELLDLNFLIKGMPFRGDRGEVELTEPESKDGASRFESRSTPRGKFSLVPEA